MNIERQLCKIFLFKNYFILFSLVRPNCELLGRKIELQKCVVQVWFQNNRAKEKKNSIFFKSNLPDEYQPTNELCKLCQYTYTYILQNPQRVCFKFILSKINLFLSLFRIISLLQNILKISVLFYQNKFKCFNN